MFAANPPRSQLTPLVEGPAYPLLLSICCVPAYHPYPLPARLNRLREYPPISCSSAVLCFPAYIYNYKGIYNHQISVYFVCYILLG